MSRIEDHTKKAKKGRYKKKKSKKIRRRYINGAGGGRGGSGTQDHPPTPQIWPWNVSLGLLGTSTRQGENKTAMKTCQRVKGEFVDSASEAKIAPKGHTPESKMCADSQSFGRD